jgi:hypothetical protein
MRVLFEPACWTCLPAPRSEGRCKIFAAFAVDIVASSCTLDRLRDSYAYENMPFVNQAETLGWKSQLRSGKRHRR